MCGGLDSSVEPAGEGSLQAKLGCLVWRRLLVSTHGERAYGDEAERHWGLLVPVLAGFGRWNAASIAICSGRTSPVDRLAGLLTHQGHRMDLKLEVVPIPVSDVDAAKAFYTEQVGFKLDHEIRPSEGMRVVQMTPPGSACSVVIGEGLPLGAPGSVKGVQLVVEDIDAVREEFAGRGIGVSDVQQLGPEGSPGSRFLFFEDPDGNTWAVQELKRS